ncbi:MAG: hypothetical protein IPJ26_03085 [Bacteroidetes bacterium]|nr:hypothetical protein [Bacteroidota bacterium]
MIDGKMCMGVMKDKIMLRINPDDREKLLKKKEVSRWTLQVVR